jgi:hypothetical protein
VARPRRIRALVTLLLAGVPFACSDPKIVIPPNGSVALDLLDSALRSQLAGSPSNQVARWTIESASADIEGFGSYEFLGTAPCTYTHNVLARLSLQTICGGSNLVLESDVARATTVRLVFAAMEVRRAFRPDLSPSGDQDGDGFPNGTDNCPLLPNPDQAPSDVSGAGAACVVRDTILGGNTVDNDGDGTGDVFDSCVWVSNPTQRDSNGDGIGDACEQVARVVFETDTCPKDGPYSRGSYVCLSLPAVALKPATGAVTTLKVDFDDRETLVDCDPAFTLCRLDRAAVVVKID